MPDQGYLRHIKHCNSVVNEVLLPWHIQGRIVGWLRPGLAEALLQSFDVFTQDDRGLHFSYAGEESFQGRSRVLAQIVDELSAQGLVDGPMGELYPVTPAGREAALCVLDRAVAAFFGIRAFGQHLNGYVRKADGIHMWIGKRATDRLVFPGRLDNMVAGGLPWGISKHENLLKEAQEEAGLARPVTNHAVPVGLIAYNRLTAKGFRPDILYCYDLELSTQLSPQNTDGEVESFMLLPLEEVARLVRETDEFKLNCNLVVIDFLLRHGFIQPDEPDYIELTLGLRPALGMAAKGS